MSDTIKLNVGGQLFEVSKDTLLKYKDTYFSGLLGGNYDREKDGVEFIDRNPDCFKVILEFMRSGLVVVPNHLTTTAIAEEADYFSFAQHMFKDAPEEVYVFDKVESYDLGKCEVRYASSLPDSSISIYITWICEKGCESYVSIYEGKKKVAAYYPHNLVTGVIKRMCVAELYPREELKLCIGKKEKEYSIKRKMKESCDGNHILELVHHVEINESSLRPKKKRKIENCG